MRFITNKWARGFVSLFVGSMVSELVFISTGDPNRPRANHPDVVMILAGITIYFVLSLVVKNKDKKLF